MATLLLILCGRDANGFDLGITGKKLLLKSTKLVFLSRDPAIFVTYANPVTGFDSSIIFDDGSGPVTLSLPKTNWKTNGSGTVFTYKNPAAPGGPSVVKIVKAKPGLIKVIAKGLPFAVPSGPASINVVLSLDGGGYGNSYPPNFHRHR